MNNITLASAQTVPFKNNIDANIKEHIRFIEKASEYEADLILFPELSLTDYVRETALELYFTPNDAGLNSLREISKEKNIIIIAGAPIKLDKELYIGAFVIFPDGKLSFYTKQYLHTGEDEYYTSGFDYDPVIKIGNETISLAICADITNPLHPEKASKRNSTIYLASIFYTPGGINEAYEQLSNYAEKYSMNVLMSNFGGESWGHESAGNSAFWSKSGKLLNKLSNNGSALLITEKKNNNWKSSIIEL